MCCPFFTTYINRSPFQASQQEKDDWETLEKTDKLKGCLVREIHFPIKAISLEPHLI